MTLLVLLAVLVVVALAAAAAAVGATAGRVKRSAQRANEVVPGTPTRAPIGWAGAHSPEATMHRRLRAAVQAARAQGAAGSTGVTHAVERGALEIDERLIAAAELPDTHRAAAIAAIEPSVVALENAVAGVRSDDTVQRPELQAAMDDVQSRVDAVAEARAEVEQLDVTRPRPASDS